MTDDAYQTYSREWVKHATPAQIIAAQSEGLLDEILIPAPSVATESSKRGQVEQWTKADLIGLPSEAVVAAQKAGHLEDLLSGRKPEQP